MSAPIVHKVAPFQLLELKCPGDMDCTCDEAEGYLKAAFCKFGDVDKDGDIVHAGAVGKQDVILSAYQHMSHRGALPVGKGRVYEEDGWGVFEGHLNMEMQSGRDHYSAMKFTGELQEFSWGFAVTEYTYTDGTSFWDSTLNIYKTEIYEVSPVLVGAGNGTHTMELKSARELYPNPAHKQPETTPSPAVIKARLAMAKLKSNRS